MRNLGNIVFVCISNPVMKGVEYPASSYKLKLREVFIRSVCCYTSFSDNWIAISRCVCSLL